MHALISCSLLLLLSKIQTQIHMQFIANVNMNIYTSTQVQKKCLSYMFPKTTSLSLKKSVVNALVFCCYKLFSAKYSPIQGKKIWLGINLLPVNISIRFHTFCMLPVQIQHRNQKGKVWRNFAYIEEIKCKRIKSNEKNSLKWIIFWVILFSKHLKPLWVGSFPLEG